MWGLHVTPLSAMLCPSPPERLLATTRVSSLRDSWLAVPPRAPATRNYRRRAMAVSGVEGSEASSRAETPPMLRLRTTPTPRLSPQDVIDSLYETVPERAQAYAAFYSSELGGIVTDPALMLVHLDDRMVHRGNGVFDTAIIVNGYVYQLEQHLQRLLASAAKAQIPLPMSAAQLRRTVLETAAASQLLNGYIRYWLSAGRAGFGLSPLDCERPALYIAAYTQRSELNVLKGWRVKTSPVDAKSPFFATLKSVGYLPNALALLDAQQSGYDQGIFVDAGGHVAEGPNMNLGIVTHDGELAVPPFDATLAGITVQRLMEIAPQHYASGEVPHVNRVSQRPLTVAECKGAREVFLCGSSLPVMPVVAWDETAIADGQPGLAALALRTALLKDMETVQEGQHLEVPYGYLTGMLDE